MAKIHTDSICAAIDSSSNVITLASRVKDAPSKEYRFDSVFSENADQKHVYETVVAPAVRGAVEGYNCTVFAYGQTGTGKTFTMEGGLEGGAAWSADHAASGMIPRAVREIFSLLEAAGGADAENSVRVSHLELFNEELIDLLGFTDDANKPLRLFEHPKEGVTIHNLETLPVTSADAIFKILRRSSQRRHDAATRLNASSSRSHCIFTITVQTKEAAADGGELIRIGRLNLIDLAGSENVARSGTNAGDAKREASVINQSLLVLGRVITALAENRSHVPYRESKLTRIMADAVGGKHRTSMIACITQAASSYDDTQATLEYALAAKKVKNRPELNAKVTKKAAIKEYLQEIERLKAQVTAAREKNGVYLAPEEFRQMQDDLKNTKDSLAKAEEQLATRAKQIEDTSAVLGTTTDKLRSTTATLEATSSDLAETKAELAETRTNLEQAQDAMEESAEVIRHQQTTEQRLHANATAILSALDVREADVEGLHAKIARKTQLEEENRSISSSFREYVGAKVEDMNAQLKRFRTSQVDHYNQVRTAVHSFMEEKNADLDALCDKLDAFVAALQDSQSKIGAVVSAHVDGVTAELQTIQQTATTGRTDIANTVQQFVASSQAAAEAWRAQLNAQRNAVTEWGVNTAALLQSAIDANEEWSATHTAALQELRGTLDANTKAALAWAEEHRRNVDASIKVHKEKTEKQQREMFRQICDLISSYVATQQKSVSVRISQLQENNTSHAAELAAQHEARAKYIEQTATTSVDSRNKKLQAEFSAMAESITAQNANEGRRATKDEGRIDKSSANVASLQSTFSRLKTQSEQRAENDLDTITERLQSAETEQRGKFEELSAATSAWRDEATEFEMVSRSSIEETRTTLESNIKALETQTSSYGEKLQAEMSGVQDQFFHYFESLREDVPTGQTPQKRSVPHPASLPRSLPDDQLFSEYMESKKSGKSVAQTPSSGASIASYGSLSPSSEFATFAAPPSSSSVVEQKPSAEFTPTQPTRQLSASSVSSVSSVSSTASKTSTVGSVQAERVSRPRFDAPTASSAAATDKKAAVKAQREKKGQVGPSRSALAPLNTAQQRK